MDAPYVEHIAAGPDAPRLRLHEADGNVWTAWDATFHEFRHHRLRHGDPRATERVFVSRDGMRRIHRLGSNSDRRLMAAVLAEQLRGAEYVARVRFRPDQDAPGRPGA